VRVKARTVALHAVPCIVVLWALVPLVADHLTAYLLVGTVALLSWLVGAVQGLSDPRPIHRERNPR
jgi:hypothetical protein